MRSRRHGVIGLALATLWISGALYMTSSPWQATGYLKMTVTELYPEEGREPLVYCSAGEDAKTIYTALSSPSYDPMCHDCIGDYQIEFSNGSLFYLSNSCRWAQRKTQRLSEALLPEETTELFKQLLDGLSHQTS